MNLASRLNLAVIVSVWLALLAQMSAGSLVVQRKLDNGSFETLTQGTHYNILGDGTIQMLQAAVSVPSGNTATLRIYRTDPVNENLAKINIDNLTKPVINVFIGGNDTTAFVDGGGFNTPGAKDWAGFVNNGNNYTLLQATITGSVTGSVTTTQIRRIDADGAIKADIHSASADPNGPIIAVVAASMDAGVTISNSASQSSIGRVRATTGNCTVQIIFPRQRVPTA